MGLVVRSPCVCFTEKATNGTQSDPDWEVILEIVEEVKTKNVT